LNIVAVGVNHKSAPVEIRERLALVPEDLPQALGVLGSFIPEAAILSTCNRTELYGAGLEPAEGVAALTSFLGHHHGLSEDELAPYLYHHTQDNAPRHLFSVASGIDSMILGETEILGQVRESLVSASAAGRVGTGLSRLFHHAMRAGRRARTETGISRHAVSVSYAAVEMARQVFGGLENSHVLVISAGEAGKLTARSLKDSGAAEVAVANRTPHRALALAKELGARVFDFDSIADALPQFDIVISATAATRYVLSADTVARAMEKRNGRPLCLVDIAVPRDIDPESRKIPNVHVYDIDDLEAVSLANVAQRGKEVSHVRRIVDEEVDRFMDWYRGLQAVPVITALQNKVEKIRARELAKSLKRLQNLSEEELGRIEALTSAITRKVLHDPIVALKRQGERDGYIAAARELFDLSDD
jgi:glutamyl-tRNA reductase